MTEAERSVWLSTLRAQSPGLADQLAAFLHEHRALSEKGFLEQRHALHAQGKRDEANSAFRSAAEHLQSTLGPNHPDTRSARQLGTHGP